MDNCADRHKPSSPSTKELHGQRIATKDLYLVARHGRFIELTHTVCKIISKN